MSHATSSEKRPVPHTPKSYPFRLRLKLKSNIHRPPSIVRIRVRYWGATASCFDMAPSYETTPPLPFLGAQAIGHLDFLQWLGGFSVYPGPPSLPGLTGVRARLFSIRHNSSLRSMQKISVSFLRISELLENPRPSTTNADSFPGWHSE